MVSVHHLNNSVDDCKKQFYQVISHSYLQQFIQEPLIDEDRLRCIFAMLEHELPKKELDVLALSMLLVEAALETHEEVSVHHMKTDFIKKNRQLTVLAGDYYCSLYYYLLADIGQIPMIQIFSESIQEINESKMNIYKQEHLPFDVLETEIKAIESLVLQNIAAYYNLPIWGQAMTEFFFLKRLLLEKDHLQEGHQSPLVRSLVNVHSDENMLDAYEQKIFESMSRLSDIATSSIEIKQFVEQLLETLLGKSRYLEKVVEEG